MGWTTEEVVWDHCGKFNPTSQRYVCGSVYVYMHYTGFNLVRKDGREAFPPPKILDLAPKKLSKYSSRGDFTSQIASETILKSLKSPIFFAGHDPRSLLDSALYSFPPKLKILDRTMLQKDRTVKTTN